MKLNRPMKKLKPGDQAEQADQLVLDREVRRADAVSPAIRPPPTMLTGLSAARSLTPDDRLADAPHLDRQRGQRDCADCLARPPICSTV